MRRPLFVRIHQAATSWLGVGVHDCELAGQGTAQTATHQAGCQDLGVLQGSHEKSSNYKPVSKATKVSSHEKSPNCKPVSRAPKLMKISPRATNKHQQLILNRNNSTSAQCIVKTLKRVPKIDKHLLSCTPKCSRLIPAARAI